MTFLPPDPPAKTPLLPGTTLGRYELLLPIAQGGMATVWAARQRGSRGFQKTVAIKTMLPNLSDDPQFEQMFLDEAALAARIHHPNVAEILDLGEQDDILYLVMEWVDGESLSVVSKMAARNDAQMPQRLALRIVAQACGGLHAAHELKDDSEQLLQLVHRDVSPQNILVTYDGIVKLVDFGVAKAIGRASAQTSAGQLKGKVPYMSPEQACGGEVDRRTDVFAMGIVLYKLTVGIHPFLGANELDTMRNIVARPAPEPRLKNPGISVELEQLLLKCLHKDPEKRFETIADLERAIDRVLRSPRSEGSDDDVGAFVRGFLGDRRQKRRAALRDAVRAADERAAGTYTAPPGAPAGPVSISDVSGLLLTRMASGLKEERLPEECGPPPSLQGLSSQAFYEAFPRPTGTSGYLLTVLAGAVVAVVAALLVFPGAPSSSHHAADPEGTATPTEEKGLPSSPAGQTAPAASEEKKARAEPAASVASTAGEEKPARTRPTASAASSPAAGQEKPAQPAGRSGGAPRRTPGKLPTPPSAKAVAEPAPSSWMPTVKNPGF